MDAGTPDFGRTLAVILGASRYPNAPTLGSPPSFARSAEAIRAYLLSEAGLNLAPAKVLNLFDNADAPHTQVVTIRNFLQQQIHSSSQLAPENVFLYYVGHGLFPDDDYHLAVRSTHEEVPGVSSLKAKDLALALKTRARTLRRFLVLDCCFAAAMTKEFMSAPAEVAVRKLGRELPKEGTALLCASSSEDFALAPHGAEFTMFASAFLSALNHGDGSFSERLSFDNIETICDEYLRREYPDGSVRPQLHSPNKSFGDIALLPIFPNPAVASPKREEAARMLELEREAVEAARKAEERQREADAQHQRAAEQEAQRKGDEEANAQREAKGRQAETAEREAEAQRLRDLELQEVAREAREQRHAENLRLQRAAEREAQAQLEANAREDREAAAKSERQAEATRLLELEEKRERFAREKQRAEAQRKEQTEADAEARRAAEAQAERQRKAALQRQAEALRQSEADRKAQIAERAVHATALSVARAAKRKEVRYRLKLALWAGSGVAALVAVVALIPRGGQSSPPSTAPAHSQPSPAPQTIPYSATLSKTLTGLTKPFRTLAVNPDGSTVVTGDEETVKVWDVSSGRLKQAYSAWGVQSVAFSSDGHTVASGQYKMVKLWDVRSKLAVQSLKGNTDYVDSVAFSPDGRLLASGSMDDTLKIWEVSTGRLLRTLTPGSGWIQSVGFSPDGQTLASGGFEGRVLLWNVPEVLSSTAAIVPRELRKAGRDGGENVASLVFGRDGHTLICGSWNESIEIWNLDTSQLVSKMKQNTQVVAVALSSDGKTLASGLEYDGAVTLWDLPSRSTIQVLGEHGDVHSSVGGLAISLDGQTLASGGPNNSINIWRLPPR